VADSQQQQQQQQHQEQHQRSPPHELSPSSHPKQEEKIFSEPSGQQLQHEEVLVEYVSLPADPSEAARLPTAAEGASTSNVQLASAAAAVVAASRDSSHTDAFGNLRVGAQSTTAVAAAIETTKALLRKIEVKGAGNLVGGQPHAQAQPAGSSLDMLEVWCCALALASAASFQPLF
jgi:hypothetical protein